MLKNQEEGSLFLYDYCYITRFVSFFYIGMSLDNLIKGICTIDHSSHFVSLDESFEIFHEFDSECKSSHEHFSFAGNRAKVT